MSLIFEALKKGRAAAAPPALGTQPILAPLASPQGRASTLPWSGTLLAVLAGMLLAGGGAWLYWAGKASNLNLSGSAPPVQVAILQSPVLAPSLIAPPPVTVPAVLKPIPVVVAAKPASALSTPPVLAVSKIVKTAAPELVAVVKTVNRPPINTQVQVSTEANAFDVREAFQAFVQRLQMGQLPEAQVAADRITAAMGRSHVMSLRAQGYLALKKNDLGQAKSQYLQLHQLLPEDREAGLNLALIDWRQGEKEAAAKRVAHLLEKFPNDPEIQALYINVRNP